MDLRTGIGDLRERRVGTLSASRWRPYGGLADGSEGLPCDSLVSVHPRLLLGESIRVCVSEESGDTALRNELLDALDVAVGGWNDLLSPNRKAQHPEQQRGLPFAVFKLVNDSNGVCPVGGNAEARIKDERVAGGACSNPCILGLVSLSTKGNPPRITGDLFVVKYSDAIHPLVSTLRHELGHLLGLGDYDYGCWRLVGAGGVQYSSVMSYGHDSSYTAPGGGFGFFPL